MAYERFANGGLSSLDAAIDNDDLALTVKSAVGFPTGGNFRIIVDSEIMLVTDVQGKTFTVTRAQEGTSAASHDADAAVFHVLTAGALAQRDIEQFATGAIANRDAAGQAGRLYLPTEGYVARDNGLDWERMPYHRFTPPVSGDFTWVNQGTATVDGHEGHDGPGQRRAWRRARICGSWSSPRRRPLTRLPSPCWPKAPSTLPRTAIPQFGICWRESGSGKLLTYGFGFNSYPFRFQYAQMDESHDACQRRAWISVRAPGIGRCGFVSRTTAPTGWSKSLAMASGFSLSRPPSPGRCFSRPIKSACSPIAGRTPTHAASHFLLALEGILMAEQFKNLASTTLNGAIDDDHDVITVASAMGFTGGDFRILVDSEIMKVTAVSGLDLTVVRGQEGTSPTSHDNGAAVRHVLTVGALDAHDQNDLVVRDAYASKPAAGMPGRLFLPTDGVFIERDNGSAWEKFGPLWPMTPPQASDFPTWVNQGSATIADNKGAIWFESPHHLRHQRAGEGEGLSQPAVHRGNGVGVSAFSQHRELRRCRALHPRPCIGQAASLRDSYGRLQGRWPQLSQPHGIEHCRHRLAGAAATSTWSNRICCGSSTRTTTPTARFRFRRTAVRGRRWSASLERTT